MHGGNVRATSAGLGQGSEFVVRLPLGESLEKAPVCGEDGAACAGQRILIVEDNDDSRQMLHYLLKLCGHCVQEAADGRQGIETIRRHPPDVALIDIGLPDLDGYQVAQMVRAEGKTVYLVALTGYGQPEDRRRALAAGFDAHMTKPVTVEELSHTLARAPSAGKVDLIPNRAVRSSA
jgi:CheY-like chemotaxis protein